MRLLYCLSNVFDIDLVVYLYIYIYIYIYIYRVLYVSKHYLSKSYPHQGQIYSVNFYIPRI